MKIVLATVVAFAALTATASAQAPIDWQPLASAPSNYQQEALRVTADISSLSAGVASSQVIGCFTRTGRLPWRCLARFTYGSTHCDVVEAIGLERVEHRRSGRLLGVTYGPNVTTQRTRSVWGTCGEPTVPAGSR